MGDLTNKLCKLDLLNQFSAKPIAGYLAPLQAEKQFSLNTCCGAVWKSTRLFRFPSLRYRPNCVGSCRMTAAKDLETCFETPFAKTKEEALECMIAAPCQAYHRRIRHLHPSVPATVHEVLCFKCFKNLLSSLDVILQKSCTPWPKKCFC